MPIQYPIHRKCNELMDPEELRLILDLKKCERLESIIAQDICTEKLYMKYKEERENEGVAALVIALVLIFVVLGFMYSCMRSMR